MNARNINRTSTALLSLIMIMGAACNKTSSSKEIDQAPADIESAYFALSSEVQMEVLGVDAKSRDEVRAELLAKADKDGDGQLSDQEKADLKAQWKELKEKMKAELKAALDKDGDGTISSEEKKVALENLGQNIKAAIQGTLEDIRAAQEEARAKIKEACASGGNSKPEDTAGLRDGGKPEGAGPADELDVDSMKQDIEKALNACQTVVQAEKEKMHEALKAALDKLHAQLDELKQKMGAIDDAQTQAS